MALHYDIIGISNLSWPGHPLRCPFADYPHKNFVCNFLYLFLSVLVLLYRLSWPLWATCWCIMWLRLGNQLVMSSILVLSFSSGR